jgi:hypothetical protein
MSCAWAGRVASTKRQACRCMKVSNIMHAAMTP